MHHVELRYMTEENGCQMTGGSVAGRTIVKLTWVLLSELHQFTNVFELGVVRHDKHQRGRRDEGDWIERGERIDLHVFEDVRINDHRSLVRHQHRVTIGSGAGRLLRRNVSACGSIVLDDHGLAELLADTMGDKARDGIGSASGSVGYQETYGAGGILLRLSVGSAK